MALEKVIKSLRDFPSVEEILQSEKLGKTLSGIPRPVAVEIVRETIDQLKEELRNQKKDLSLSRVFSAVQDQIRIRKRAEITKVINASGIIVHTNLGRAPLPESIFDAIKKTVVGYGNIEFDLDTGVRGKRGEACERYLALLSGAEAGTVVNNCAAALFVSLNTFANRKEVIISRSELVQIGGGFRIPDILIKSGAKLREIGTTNITTIRDYEEAISEKTALMLKVHQSNFMQKGFTEGVDLRELVSLGKRHSIPVINDLGSGVFIPTREILGYAEPTVQQSVRDGADITCFSGDKMLGGCQAGLIVGGKEYVKKIKKNPVFRVMRGDKIVFSMLERLLTFYLDGTWRDNIKLWSVLSVSESELYKRGKALLKNLGNPSGLSVEATVAYVGGGALPESRIPSVGAVFSSEHKATALMKKFRDLEVPIIGRIDNDRFILDLKGVDEADLGYLERAIRKVLA